MPLPFSTTAQFMGGETRFGRLTLIKEIGLHTSKAGRHMRQGLFRCDCGEERIALLDNVKRGRTPSCTCLIGDEVRGRRRKP